MDAHPITLIVGTGAAVLIARTFYESFNSARGHSSAIRNRTKELKLPVSAKSKENKVCEVNEEAVDQKYIDNASTSICDDLKENNEASSEIEKELVKNFDEKISESNIDSSLVEPSNDTNKLECEEKETAKESSVDHSLNNSSNEEFAKFAAEIRDKVDFIKLHSCTYCLEDSRNPSQRSDQGLEACRERSERSVQGLEADRKRSDRSSQVPQDNTKQSASSVYDFKGATTLPSSNIQVHEDVPNRPESTVHGFDQSKHVLEDAVDQPASIHVSEHADTHVSENVVKEPGSKMSVSEYAEHFSESVTERSEGSVHVHERSENISENVVKRLQSSVYVSEHLTIDNKQPEEVDDGSENPLELTSSQIDQEINRSIEHESLKHSKENPPQLVMDDFYPRPETPASHFDPEHIRSAVETLCAIYNEQQKYNKDAKNWLLQIKMAQESNLGLSDEGPGNMTHGPAFQKINLFVNEIRGEHVNDDTTSQIIDSMNEYLVSDEQDDDLESYSAESESNVESDRVEDDIHEDHARDNFQEDLVQDDVQEDRVQENVEEDQVQENVQEDQVQENVQEDQVLDEIQAENTSNSTLTNTLIIYVKDKNENDDAKSEEFKDIDVVSCNPDIFQNVIVRKIIKDS